MKVAIQIALLIWGLVALGVSLHILKKAETESSKTKKIEEENRRLLDGIDTKIRLIECKISEPGTFKEVIEKEVLKSEVERLKKQLRGERVCDGYCDNCKHSFKAEMFDPNGWHSGYKCGLDCKCPDFDPEESGGREND